MMIDLKRPKEKAPGPPEVAPDSREIYAYGLRIRLENHELDKLGMELPDVTSTLTFKIKCDVLSVHENKRAVMAGEKSDRGVELQIIAMDMENDED